MEVSKPAVGIFAAFHDSEFVPWLQNKTLIGIWTNSENKELVLIYDKFVLELDNDAHFIRCATPLLL